jgi:hypothetical protein
MIVIMSNTPATIMKRDKFDRILASAGTVVCLAFTAFLWINIGAQQSLWPLPALYFIEMAALSMACALLVFFDGSPLGRFITWGAVGIFTAFSILGVLSVGFFYLPVAIIFAVIALRSDLRNKQHMAAHIGIGLLAGIVQAALMLVAIHFLF